MGKLIQVGLLESLTIIAPPLGCPIDKAVAALRVHLQSVTLYLIRLVNLNTSLV